MFHVPEGLRFLESQSLRASGVPETSKIPPFPSYSFWKLVQGLVQVVVGLFGGPVVVQLVWFVTPSIMMFLSVNMLMALRCTFGPLSRILLGVQPVGKVTFPPPPPPPAPPSNIASILRVATPKVPVEMALKLFESTAVILTLTLSAVPPTPSRSSRVRPPFAAD